MPSPEFLTFLNEREEKYRNAFGPEHSVFYTRLMAGINNLKKLASGQGDALLQQDVSWEDLALPMLAERILAEQKAGIDSDGDSYTQKLKNSSLVSEQNKDFENDGYLKRFRTTEKFFVPRSADSCIADMLSSFIEENNLRPTDLIINAAPEVLKKVGEKKSFTPLMEAATPEISPSQLQEVAAVLRNKARSYRDQSSLHPRRSMVRLAQDASDAAQHFYEAIKAMEAGNRGPFERLMQSGELTKMMLYESIVADSKADLKKTSYVGLNADNGWIYTMGPKKQEFLKNSNEARWKMEDEIRSRAEGPYKFPSFEWFCRSVAGVAPVKKAGGYDALRTGVQEKRRQQQSAYYGGGTMPEDKITLQLTSRKLLDRAIALERMTLKLAANPEAGIYSSNKTLYREIPGTEVLRANAARSYRVLADALLAAGQGDMRKLNEFNSNPTYMRDIYICERLAAININNKFYRGSVQLQLTNAIREFTEKQAAMGNPNNGRLVEAQSSALLELLGWTPGSPAPEVFNVEPLENSSEDTDLDPMVRNDLRKEVKVYTPTEIVRWADSGQWLAPFDDPEALKSKVTASWPVPKHNDDTVSDAEIQIVKDNFEGWRKNFESKDDITSNRRRYIPYNVSRLIGEFGWKKNVKSYRSRLWDKIEDVLKGEPGALQELREGKVLEKICLLAVINAEDKAFQTDSNYVDPAFGLYKAKLTNDGVDAAIQLMYDNKLLKGDPYKDLTADSLLRMLYQPDYGKYLLQVSEIKAEEPAKKDLAKAKMDFLRRAKSPVKAEQEYAQSFKGTTSKPYNGYHTWNYAQCLSYENEQAALIITPPVLELYEDTMKLHARLEEILSTSEDGSEELTMNKLQPLFDGRLFTKALLMELVEQELIYHSDGRGYFTTRLREEGLTEAVLNDFEKKIKLNAAELQQSGDVYRIISLAGCGKLQNLGSGVDYQDVSKLLSQPYPQKTPLKLTKTLTENLKWKEAQNKCKQCGEQVRKGEESIKAETDARTAKNAAKKQNETYAAENKALNTNLRNALAEEIPVPQAQEMPALQHFPASVQLPPLPESRIPQGSNAWEGWTDQPTLEKALANLDRQIAKYTVQYAEARGDAEEETRAAQHLMAYTLIKETILQLCRGDDTALEKLKNLSPFANISELHDAQKSSYDYTLALIGKNLTVDKSTPVISDIAKALLDAGRQEMDKLEPAMLVGMAAQDNFTVLPPQAGPQQNAPAAPYELPVTVVEPLPEGVTRELISAALESIDRQLQNARFSGSEDIEYNNLMRLKAGICRIAAGENSFLAPETDFMTLIVLDTIRHERKNLPAGQRGHFESICISKNSQDQNNYEYSLPGIRKAGNQMAEEYEFDINIIRQRMTPAVLLKIAAGGDYRSLIGLGRAETHFSQQNAQDAREIYTAELAKVRAFKDALQENKPLYSDTEEGRKLRELFDKSAHALTEFDKALGSSEDKGNNILSRLDTDPDLVAYYVSKQIIAERSRHLNATAELRNNRSAAANDLAKLTNTRYSLQSSYSRTLNGSDRSSDPEKKMSYSALLSRHLAHVTMGTVDNSDKYEFEYQRRVKDIRELEQKLADNKTAIDAKKQQLTGLSQQLSDAENAYRTDKTTYEYRWCNDRAALTEEVRGVLPFKSARLTVDELISGIGVVLAGNQRPYVSGNDPRVKELQDASELGRQPDVDVNADDLHRAAAIFRQWARSYANEAATHESGSQTTELVKRPIAPGSPNTRNVAAPSEQNIRYKLETKAEQAMLKLAYALDRYAAGDRRAFDALDKEALADDICAAHLSRVKSKNAESRQKENWQSCRDNLSEFCQKLKTGDDSVDNWQRMKEGLSSVSELTRWAFGTSYMSTSLGSIEEIPPIQTETPVAELGSGFTAAEEPYHRIITDLSDARKAAAARMVEEAQNVRAVDLGCTPKLLEQIERLEPAVNEQFPTDEEQLKAAAYKGVIALLKSAKEIDDEIATLQGGNNAKKIEFLGKVQRAYREVAEKLAFLPEGKKWSGDHVKPYYDLFSEKNGVFDYICLYERIRSERASQKPGQFTAAFNSANFTKALLDIHGSVYMHEFRDGGEGKGPDSAVSYFTGRLFGNASLDDVSGHFALYSFLPLPDLLPDDQEAENSNDLDKIVERRDLYVPYSQNFISKDFVQPTKYFKPLDPKLADLALSGEGRLAQLDRAAEELEQRFGGEAKKFFTRARESIAQLRTILQDTKTNPQSDAFAQLSDVSDLTMETLKFVEKAAAEWHEYTQANPAAANKPAPKMTTPYLHSLQEHGSRGALAMASTDPDVQDNKLYFTPNKLAYYLMTQQQKTAIADDPEYAAALDNVKDLREDYKEINRETLLQKIRAGKNPSDLEDKTDGDLFEDYFKTVKWPSRDEYDDEQPEGYERYVEEYQKDVPYRVDVNVDDYLDEFKRLNERLGKTVWGIQNNSPEFYALRCALDGLESSCRKPGGTKMDLRKFYNAVSPIMDLCQKYQATHNAVDSMNKNRTVRMKTMTYLQGLGTLIQNGVKFNSVHAKLYMYAIKLANAKAANTYKSGNEAQKKQSLRLLTHPTEFGAVVNDFVKSEKFTQFRQKLDATFTGENAKKNKISYLNDLLCVKSDVVLAKRGDQLELNENALKFPEADGPQV